MYGLNRVLNINRKNRKNSIFLILADTRRSTVVKQLLNNKLQYTIYRSSDRNNNLDCCVVEKVLGVQSFVLGTNNSFNIELSEGY